MAKPPFIDDCVTYVRNVSKEVLDGLEVVFPSGTFLMWYDLLFGSGLIWPKLGHYLLFFSLDTVLELTYCSALGFLRGANRKSFGGGPMARFVVGAPLTPLPASVALDPLKAVTLAVLFVSMLGSTSFAQSSCQTW